METHVPIMKVYCRIISVLAWFVCDARSRAELQTVMLLHPEGEATKWQAPDSPKPITFRCMFVDSSPSFLMAHNSKNVEGAISSFTVLIVWKGTSPNQSITIANPLMPVEDTARPIAVGDLPPIKIAFNLREFEKSITDNVQDGNVFCKGVLPVYQLNGDSFVLSTFIKTAVFALRIEGRRLIEARTVDDDLFKAAEFEVFRRSWRSESENWLQLFAEGRSNFGRFNKTKPLDIESKRRALQMFGADKMEK